MAFLFHVRLPAPFWFWQFLSGGKQPDPIAHLPRLRLQSWMIARRAILDDFSLRQLTVGKKHCSVIGTQTFPCKLEQQGTATLFIEFLWHQNKEMFLHGEASKVDLWFLKE